MQTLCATVMVLTFLNNHANQPRLHLNHQNIPEYMQGTINLTIQSPLELSSVFKGPWASLYQLNEDDDVRTQRIQETDRHVFYRAAQFHQGLRVVKGDLIIQTDREGHVMAVLGSTVPDINLIIEPSISVEQALEVAIIAQHREVVDLDLVIYPTEAQPALAYQLDLWLVDDAGWDYRRVYLDAHSGEHLGGFTHVHNLGLNREIYTVNWDCVQYVSQIPGWLWYDESTSNWQTFLFMPFEGKQAYWNTGTSYHFFKKFLGRDSYDGQGSSILSSINVEFPTSTSQCSPNNAAFIGNGINQFLFGDGDGNILDYPSQALDVTAHELMHGVTEFTSNLDYEFESGAINESMSDIFGAGAEAWSDSLNLYGANRAGNPKLMHPFFDTWQIGEDAVGPAKAPALRFMDNPAQDNQSADYHPDKNYPNCTNPTQSNDHCGVHTNSGIGNLAFYLLSEGGLHPQSKTNNAVFGIGITKALRVFFEANTYLLSSSDDYQALRYATGQAAINLYGVDSGEYVSVMEAWDAVGVPGSWTVPSSCNLDVERVFMTNYASPQIHAESYMIDVTGSLAVTLTWPHGANLFMEILDPNFNTVAVSQGPVRVNSRTLSIDASTNPGRYTIYVSSNSWLPSAFHFDLDVTYQP